MQDDTLRKEAISEGERLFKLVNSASKQKKRSFFINAPTLHVETDIDMLIRAAEAFRIGKNLFYIKKHNYYDIHITHW